MAEKRRTGVGSQSLEGRIKILVGGSRSFTNYALLSAKLDKYIQTEHPDAVILSGACPHGADMLAEKWAYSHWHTVMRFHADWVAHGKAAGLIRNVEMVKVADLAIFFWDGKSPGTKHCIEKAKARGVRRKIIRFT
jgi:hypothetical protein